MAAVERRRGHGSIRSTGDDVRGDWKRARDRLESPLARSAGVTAYELRRELQDIAAGKVGVLRTGDALQQAVDRIEDLRRTALPRLASRAQGRRFNREWVECLQAESMLSTLQAIAGSALFREESRGAHYRRDFPQTDNDRWRVNTVAREREGELQIATGPVRTTSLEPAA